MEKFEVIVVGAGLAGLAAAYTLAGNGVEVVVLERGDYPGAKKRDRRASVCPSGSRSFP